MYIETIDSPADLKAMSLNELEALAQEIRQALISRAKTQDEHLSANLGVVEATIALHYVFDSPRDTLVFDVSHQTYAHKMLTGRKEAFLDPAHYDDVSAFASPAESVHDPFIVGHTSTSVSLAAGIAHARDLAQGTGRVVAFIGDGSLSGGEAFEGLDLAAELGGNLVIVVNDNEMSIAPNHGGLYQNLAELRKTQGASANNYFKSLGLDYRYVEEGNSLAPLIEAFNQVKDATHPVVVHIHTTKGLGLEAAEKDPERYHHVRGLTASGEPHAQAMSWSDLTVSHLTKLMEHDPQVVTVCAATPTGLGFTQDKREAIPAGQFVDVGIAEQTAVTFCAGLAQRGAKPVLCIYSTFLPRAADQLIQELCVNSLPAVILVDKGSVYGSGPVSHLGLQDMALLGNLPNMLYLAPANPQEYVSMMDWAVDYTQGPVAIKIPGGEPYQGDVSSKVVPSAQVALVGVGTFFSVAKEAAQALQAQGIQASLINPQVISDVSPQLAETLKAHKVIVTLEDGMIAGGYGAKVACALAATPTRVLVRAFESTYTDRMDPQDRISQARLTAAQIAADALEALHS